jgi:hypothetical protein
MTRGNAESDGRIGILHVDAELLQAQCCEEQLLDLRGDAVEGVSKVGRRGRIAVVEAEVVRRDNVKVAGEQRDQLPEHVRRRRKAMKQNDRRICGRAGLAVEDLVALDVGMLVSSHVIALVSNAMLAVEMTYCSKQRTGCFQHELYDGRRRRDLRSMIYIVRTDLCAHALGHKSLCLRAEHTVIFSQQIPRRFRPPGWSLYRFTKTSWLSGVALLSRLRFARPWLGGQPHSSFLLPTSIRDHDRRVQDGELFRGEALERTSPPLFLPRLEAWLPHRLALGHDGHFRGR